MNTTLFVPATIALCLCIAAPSMARGDDPESAAKVDDREVISSEEALSLLIEGNDRFVQGNSKHPHEGKMWRRQLVSGQSPFATIVGCSDSRVSPELIFDEGLGDLFVIRNAGHLVDQSVVASIEYAVEHLDTRLVVVLGHDNCGAVTAALAPPHDEPRELSSLVNQIHNSLYLNRDPEVDGKLNITQAVRKNVMFSVRLLRTNPTLHRCLEQHDAEVVGAIYHLHNGRVYWLEHRSNPAASNH